VIIDVDLYGKIRHMHVQQKMSQRAIARELGISRSTVKKYCQGHKVPRDRKPYKREPSLVTEEVKDFISQCFDQDEEENLPKQSHTARKIYNRLVEKRGFTGAESTIRRIIREMRPSVKEAFVPLEFDPGEAAQVDWGEATIYLKGERIRFSYFAIGFATVPTSLLKPSTGKIKSLF
jgi:transposase